MLHQHHHHHLNGSRQAGRHKFSLKSWCSFGLLCPGSVRVPTTWGYFRLLASWQLINYQQWGWAQQLKWKWKTDFQLLSLSLFLFLLLLFHSVVQLVYPKLAYPQCPQCPLCSFTQCDHIRSAHSNDTAGSNDTLTVHSTMVTEIITNSFSRTDFKKNLGKICPTTAIYFNFKSSICTCFGNYKNAHKIKQ